MAVSPTHTGWRRDDENSRVDIYYEGTRMAHFTSTAFNLAAGATAGMTITAGGLTITAGGISITAGPIGVNDDVSIELGTDDDSVLRHRSTTLGANTALTDVLIGTPAAAATPANSLLISNVTADGDIALFTVNAAGANSIEMLRLDASAGLIVVNEASADVDFRVETDGIAFAIYSDGAKNALVLGSNTDTSSADQLITVSRAARTATAATNYFDLAMAPAGAVTIPAGITALVAEVSIAEPNITATGTVTNATTLYIAGQPTEGGTTNSAILFGAAANIACTTSLTFNDDSVDIDFRFESDGLAYAIYSDGGKNALVLGSNTDTSSVDQLITVSRAARTATANTNYFDLAMAPAGAVTVPAGTTTVVAEVSIAEPNITATGTVTNATTLYIASQPTEGGTTNSAILFGAAANIAGTTSITVNDDAQDVDFRVEGDNNANMLVIDAGTDSMALGSAIVAGAALSISNVTGRTLVTAVGNAVHIPAGSLTDGGVTGTIAVLATALIGARTILATNTITYSDAAGLYVLNPVASTGATFTRIRSIWAEGNIQIGAPATFGTTQPTAALILKTGTAPAGTVATSGALFSDGTVIKKIIADGTVSNVET